MLEAVLYKCTVIFEAGLCGGVKQVSVGEGLCDTLTSFAYVVIIFMTFPLFFFTVFASDGPLIQLVPCLHCLDNS